MSRALGRVAIVPRALPPDSDDATGGVGESAQPGDERRIGLPAAATDVGVAEVAGHAGGERRQGQRRVGDVAERRADRAPLRLAADVDPRRAGVRSDAAPQGLRAAGRKEHVESSVGWQRDAELRRAERRGREAERVGTGTGADRVDHRRIRVDRQPQRDCFVVAEGSESVERDAGVLDRDVQRRVAGGIGRAHVGELGDAHQLVGATGAGVVAVVALDDVAAHEEGADHEHDGHGHGEGTGLQLSSFVSATAWRSPSSSITRLSTSCS